MSKETSNEFWALVGFIKVSPARLNCIRCIGKEYKMPTEIAKESDCVLVPCVAHYNSILRTIETINEIRAVNSKILVLNTNFTLESQREQVENLLSEKFDNLEFFRFRQSRIIENSVASASSFLELANENPLAKVSYKNFMSEYERLLKTLKNI